MTASDLPAPERAILVGVVLPHMHRDEGEDHLDELARLTETAGGLVVDRLLQDKDRLDAAYFVGRGKAEEIAAHARGRRADLIIFDDDLSPAQIRNLEKLIGARVIDRSGLILDIFARRARTREARTQVELAQLNYLLPRLARRWTHLSRQAGGIGGRGIGETQIEIDRRIIRRRIARLETDLGRIEKERSLRRTGRRGVVKCALIGYTNSGKSTLLNALAKAGAFVEDRLFATLDPLVRRVELGRGRDVLLIDTVGFIRKLPHHLVASFRSTLEEAAGADLLLHVVDISHPKYEEQIEVTEQALGGSELSGKPILTVFNKMDRVHEPGILDRARRLHPGAVVMAAALGEGLEELKARLREILEQDLVERSIRLSSSDAEGISRVYLQTQVLDARYDNGYVDLTFRASRARAQALARMAPRLQRQGAEDAGAEETGA
ncbi:MAG TPA: GTPase HflX [Candidatus Polarisedimenticolia bacterium]|nr:GTPase HflX [Candidatus Polarisedimenticolia bacterium]